MLERQTLLLSPWTPADGPCAGSRRAVLDGPGGPALGFVCRTRRGLRWLHWLTSPRLEVYETEDASLLCTVSAPAWGRGPYAVRDAEGRFVGSVVRGLVFDPYGRRLAEGRRSGEATRLVNPAGLELGVFVPYEGGTLLTFHTALEGDPFARMLLLGATLVLT